MVQECKHPEKDRQRDSSHGISEEYCGLCGLVLDEEKFEDLGYSYKKGIDIGSFVGTKNTKLRIISDRSALTHKESNTLKEKRIITSMVAVLSVPQDLVDERVEGLLNKYRQTVRNHVPLKILFPVLIYIACIDAGFSISPFHIRKPFGLDRKHFFRALRQIRKTLGKGSETSAEPFIIAAADRADMQLSPPVLLNAKKLAREFSGPNMPSGISPSILALAIIYICLWQESHWLPLTSFCETAKTSSGVIRRALSKIGYDLDKLIATEIEAL